MSANHNAELRFVLHLRWSVQAEQNELNVLLMLRALAAGLPSLLPLRQTAHFA